MTKDYAVGDTVIVTYGFFKTKKGKITKIFEPTRHESNPSYGIDLDEIGSTWYTHEEVKRVLC